MISGLFTMYKPYYFAISGETAVMSELSLRGYNAAMPILDDGDDLYVTAPDTNLIRVQVKSANCLKIPFGFVGKVRVKLAQLKDEKKTPLVYVFAFRWQECWYHLV